MQVCLLACVPVHSSVRLLSPTTAMPLISGSSVCLGAHPQGLLQLFRENGLPIPLQKCGPCQVWCRTVAQPLAGSSTGRGQACAHGHGQPCCRQAVAHVGKHIASRCCHCTILRTAAPTLVQYKLGTAKLAVRLVNGRLVGRAGAGQQIDLFEWLERQPVAPT